MKIVKVRTSKAGFIRSSTPCRTLQELQEACDVIDYKMSTLGHDVIIDMRIINA